MNYKNKSRNFSLTKTKHLFNINTNQSYKARTIKSINYSKNKIKIRPPFNPGVFSYNKPNNYNHKNETKKSRNIKNKSMVLFPSKSISLNPNYVNSNYSNEKNNNYFNNMFLSSMTQKTNQKNSTLSQPLLNLNKYKINTNENSIIHSVESNNRQNINKYINKSVNLNINFNYQNLDINKEKNTIQLPRYKNNFISKQKYQIESRRMILEYIKILNKNEKNIKNVLEKNNISELILNQKQTTKPIKKVNFNNINSIKINNNDILLGNAKKDIFLNNLNYSSSVESKDNSSNEEYYESCSNKKSLFEYIKLFNNKYSFIESLNNQKNKKINITNFLFVPKVLNLIEYDKSKKKYIFVITPDENTYKIGNENYKLIWRNMINYEIENEFRLKDIKDCYINEKYKNRFIIKVIIDEFGNDYKFEIETPTNEICEYLSYGIKYLAKKFG